MRRLVLASVSCIVAGAAASACALAGRSADTSAAALPLRVVRIARAHEPVYVTQPPGDRRLFVVQKDGLIRVLTGGRLQSAAFADLRSDVRDRGEQGLLSVAFHPGFARNGRLFVDFTDRRGDTRIWELHARLGATHVDAGHRQILFVHQPFPNHNGGQLQFGPDGDLYIGMGDGGSEDDPQHNGQNMGTLLSKLLRVDVDASAGSRPYGIPDANPFQGRSGMRPEIYALGLRNPWRFSFDRSTGALYIGDVGQNTWEEIDALARGAARGANFGWSAYEARARFGAPLESTGRLVFPVTQYSHHSGCSVTGGYVYRGTRIPALRGTYLYSDYCTPHLWGFRLANGRATHQVSYDAAMHAAGLDNVVSFGQDQQGELYLTSLDGGVYELEPR